MSLRELQLNDNDLHGNIPAEIGNLFQLEYGSRSKNRLTGEIPTGFGRLFKLKVLKNAAWISLRE